MWLIHPHFSYNACILTQSIRLLFVHYYYIMYTKKQTDSYFCYTTQNIFLLVLNRYSGCRFKCNYDTLECLFTWIMGPIPILPNYPQTFNFASYSLLSKYSVLLHFSCIMQLSVSKVKQQQHNRNIIILQQNKRENIHTRYFLLLFFNINVCLELFESSQNCINDTFFVYSLFFAIHIIHIWEGCYFHA